MIIATVPFLPLLAASLALVGGPRSERRAALFIGLAILIVYYETLSFGEALVKNGMLPSAIGLWLPFLCLAAGHRLPVCTGLARSLAEAAAPAASLVAGAGTGGLSTALDGLDGQPLPVAPLF